VSRMCRQHQDGAGRYKERRRDILVPAGSTKRV
jgi:hypothetical protein